MTRLICHLNIAFDGTPTTPVLYSSPIKPPSQSVHPSILRLAGPGAAIGFGPPCWTFLISVLLDFGNVQRAVYLQRQRNAKSCVSADLPECAVPLVFVSGAKLRPSKTSSRHRCLSCSNPTRTDIQRVHKEASVKRFVGCTDGNRRSRAQLTDKLTLRSWQSSVPCLTRQADTCKTTIVSPTQL